MYKSKRISFFMLIIIILQCCNQDSGIVLKTDSTKLNINANGYFTSIKVDDKELLQSADFPLISVFDNGKIILPQQLKRNSNNLIISMEDGQIVKLSFCESDVCIVLEVTEIPESYDALLYGPIGLNINEVVGDIIGVVQGDDIAFGVQALNIKTVAGLPYEYKDIVSQHFKYEGKPAEVSTSTIPAYRLAATNIGDGSILQFSCRNRSKTEYRKVQEVEHSLTLPITGTDAMIQGSKIAVFGCKAKDALKKIGDIEIEQSLPHPMYDDEWGKTNRSCMQSYLITNFSEETLDFVIDKAKKAGFKYIYEMDAFETWGHFRWNQNFVKGGDEAVRKMVERAEQQGVYLGIHTLSNFITTNDSYVTPIPSSHLLKQGILELINDINAKQTEIKIKPNEYFSMPMTLNALQIDDELIQYGGYEQQNDKMVLTDCQRGAFGTKAAAHHSSQPMYKLWDYPYRTLFPDIVLQDSMSARLVKIFNNTGLRQISFDGLEGCCYTGQDDYATARFVLNCYKGWNNPIINDASNLNHYTWHIHNRMNWGEPWGETMREGQVKARIKNQDFFRRNLFPRMLGWFLIRLSDNKFECTSLEDLEWALSESAGFDAGYAMTINQNVLQNHGRIDQLLEAIKNWDLLRFHQKFTEEQQTNLRNPQTEWHLEKIDDQQFNLYQLNISKRYYCNMNELQPGQPAGSDWSIESPYGGACAVRLYVDGVGSIENPKLTTPQGTIMFPCTVQNGQYLLYEFSGKASITDKNYNELQQVTPEGKIGLTEGMSNISFYCNRNENETPEVVVRLITRRKADTINIQN